MLRVLFYGDIDLNIIDGSAIWLTSMCRLMQRVRHSSNHLLLKSPFRQPELMKEISDIKNLSLIEAGEAMPQMLRAEGRRLQPREAVKCITWLHERNGYHLIVARGFKLVEHLVQQEYSHLVAPYITDFQNTRKHFSEEEKEKIRDIYDRVRLMFVQTEATRDYLQDMLRIDGKKFQLLMPMIPDLPDSQPDFKIKNYSMVYVGKFAKDWYMEEIIHAFQKINAHINYVTLNVAGNKFHQDINHRRKWIVGQLNNNRNISWFGGVSRNEAQEIIQNSDIGICWRSAIIDNDESLELSTKLLEYGRAGKPVLLRRTRLHEELLGEDYEAFVDSEAQFVETTYRLFNDPETYRRCAKRVYDRSGKFTFSERSKDLTPLLESFGPKKKKLLFAGHDFKFLNLAISHFTAHQDFEVQADQWQGHNKHDEKKSEKLLEWADIVFCEWGLGNTVWYSRRRKPWQRLIVRMHLQECVTSYPRQFDLENIDQIIVVSPYMLELFHKKFNLPRSKLKSISNMIDTEPLDQPKNVVEIHFNLGICGILPKRKRPDKAIDILEKLYQQDKRYKLFIKSKKPEDLPWLMSRPEEQQYYEQLEKKIQTSPARDRIIFDPHGDDMAEWFRKIGYILSTSEFESFHLTPLEGMASGTVPVILDWPGSRAVHDQQFIFGGIDEAANFIQSEESRALIGAAELKRYVIGKCGLSKVFSQFEQMILDKGD